MNLVGDHLDRPTPTSRRLALLASSTSGFEPLASVLDAAITSNVETTAGLDIDWDFWTSQFGPEHFASLMNSEGVGRPLGLVKYEITPDYRVVFG